MGASAEPVLLTSDQFGHWLGGSWKRKVLFITGSLVPALSGVFALASKIEASVHIDWQYFFAGALILQTVLIGILLFFFLPTPIRDSEGSPRATIVVGQFEAAWGFLILAWFMEFIGLSVKEVLNQVDPGFLLRGSIANELTQTLLDTLNNITAGALAICYVVLSEKTVLKDQGGSPVARQLPWHQVVGLLSFVAVLECIVRLFPIFKHTAFVWDFGAGFGWLSGFSVGLATAMVIGRLDSKFIGLKPWVLTLLYLYAVIQAGWGGFQDDVVLSFVLLNMALGLKCLFFSVVYWLSRSGVFLFYFERVAGIYDEVAPQRRLFLARAQRSMSAVASNKVGTHPQGGAGRAL